MGVKSKIVQLSSPTLAIDELSYADIELTNNDNNNSNSADKKQKKNIDQASPDKNPLIKIRDYIFLTSEMDFIQLNVGRDFLPTITCTLTPTGGLFLSKDLPKDGDLISFFMASKSDQFKPIRIDFEIIRIISSLSGDSQANNNSYTFSGVMRVPLLNGEWNQSFNKSSIDCLQEVAQINQIGFATNETTTNDVMPWINPYDTWKKFISDVTLSSWNNQDSFYSTFIDQYYNLNYVNLNNQFAGEETIDDGFIKSLFQSRKVDGDTPPENLQTPLVITNLEAARNTNFYIESYTVLNRSGEIVMDNAYGRYMQFYSSDTKKYYSDQLVEPINTTNGDNLPLRGRNGENYQSLIRKYKWMGVERPLPKGNYHENFLYAKIQNLQNNDEVKKMVLHVQLQSANFNFYRYQKIPVLIMVTDHPQRNDVNKSNEPNQQSKQSNSSTKSADLTRDPILSGFYVIDEIIYIYENDSFKQQLKLMRREWPLSTSDQPNVNKASTTGVSKTSG